MKKFSKILCVLLVFATLLTSFNVTEAQAAKKQNRKSGTKSGVEYKASDYVYRIQRPDNGSMPEKYHRAEFLIVAFENTNNYSVQVTGTIEFYDKNNKKMKCDSYDLYIDNPLKIDLVISPNERRVFKLQEPHYNFKHYKNYKVIYKVKKLSTAKAKKLKKAEKTDHWYILNHLSTAEVEQAGVNRQEYISIDRELKDMYYEKEEYELLCSNLAAWQYELAQENAGVFELDPDDKNRILTDIREAEEEIEKLKAEGIEELLKRYEELEKRLKELEECNLHYYNKGDYKRPDAGKEIVSDILQNDMIKVNEISYELSEEDNFPRLFIDFTYKKDARTASCSYIYYYDKDGYPISFTRGTDFLQVQIEKIYKGNRIQDFIPYPLDKKGNILDPYDFDIVFNLSPYKK